MYGVLLAGGTGSRLWPHTITHNKHTLPVYDMPMIFHPLRNLIRAGIRDVVVVTGGEHYGQIKYILDTIEIDERSKRLLKLHDSLNLRYRLQDKPAGIADALALADWIVRGQPVAVMLADNVFEDDEVLADAVNGFRNGAHIFLKELPEEAIYEQGKDGKSRAKYGMAKVKDSTVVEIIEKPAPEKLPSRYAVTGAYLYDNTVFRIARTLTPSGRGELEITDVNNEYIKTGNIKYSTVEGWWGDAGESVDGWLAVNNLAEKKCKNQQKSSIDGIIQH